MDRRSIRDYKPEPVRREQMDTIVMCGINAPSAMNKQPWEIRIVDSQEFINGVTELYKKSAEGNERMLKMVNDPSFKNMFRNAPTVAFIANQISGQGSNSSSQLDCGLLIENMLIAAQSMGIGSVCLGSPAAFMKTPEAAEYLKKLNFTEGYDLLLCVGFGYPDQSPYAKPREASKAVFID